MAILVQKFGGTSVGGRAPHPSGAARRAVRAKLAGQQVVLVVSAMGPHPDHLIIWRIRFRASRPSAR